METHRLHIRMGDAEFSAEGSEDTVRRQFDEFKELLAKYRVGSATIQGGTGTEASGRPGLEALGEVRNLFNVTDREDHPLITLRFLPREDKAPAAMLLILFGYRQLGFEEVSVIWLREALTKSGVSVTRLDRGIAPPLERENLIRKTGVKKAARYWLTNPGVSRAQAQAANMLEQI